MNVFDDDETNFRVVVNGEEQYSIWPNGKAIPDGWREVSVTGDKKMNFLPHLENAILNKTAAAGIDV
jgi:MbtH protein